MKYPCILLLLLQQVKADDLRYDSCVYWMVSEGFGLPQFSERRVMNDVTLYHHDSSLDSKMPCPDWLNTTAGKEYWKIFYHWTEYNRDVSTLGLQLATEQFNQTGSLTDRNIYQGFGCCSLYPNGTYRTLLAHAFNGKDFISFDFHTKTFVAAVPQAVLYKSLRDKDLANIEDIVALYKTPCLERLKILKDAPRVKTRKAPEVRIIEKKNTGSVTVTCHVTGFYPREVQVFWLGSDLQPVDEGVTEILPNGDGTYQTRKSVIVPEEDVGKQNYSCVVLHISIPNNITTVWAGEKAGGVAVWGSVCVCILLAAAVGFGVWWCRRKTRDAVI
ncbi:class I histocompatibility antigen, F10 alpha chain-like [Astyanax mexicanus]|uniref:class I histocompatibility antigen, F10 alpha chain-like n=1 Tax=Astyanax mexicanus TaxID=7994 RepID=UPI0020CB3663|nr:class I histocompatibility antigen, F10 alpha chain-like [Astyanax mexicanus]